ncbi:MULTISPECIES: PTS sugar transporter subunit IIB [Clostridium]|uniref:PTS sugar transporter subunit IIB n=1 Tax=Clostridium TaxID=1485 RepID=UPI000824034D|nr:MULTISPECIES: PTS sugar transporter subunit IIB [Clostridium]PJI07904.1 PTS sugar transporter subunit IIB [Clostridium sp. CT7]
MIRISLFCGAGMSSSMLVPRIKKAAEKRGIEVAVDAFSEVQFSKQLNKWDIALIGPQIAFKLPKLKKLCNDKIPIEIIPSRAYGMMDGEKVLEFALKVLNNE